MASIMGAPPLLRSLLLGLCTVLLAFNFSSATQQTERIVAVVGYTECSDCARNSVKNEEAIKGLHAAIQCKTGNGSYETKGVGLLDENGSFDVRLPSNVLRDDGELKDECFAQLRSALEAPCRDKDGLDQSKIVLKSKESGKHTFVVAAGKLSFSSTCTSAFPKLHSLQKYFLVPVPNPLPAPVHEPPIVKKPHPPVTKKPHPPIPKLPPEKPCPPVPKKPRPPVPKKPCPPCPPPCPPCPPPRPPPRPPTCPPCPPPPRPPTCPPCPPPPRPPTCPPCPPVPKKRSPPVPKKRSPPVPKKRSPPCPPVPKEPHPPTPKPPPLE